MRGGFGGIVGWPLLDPPDGFVHLAFPLEAERVAGNCAHIDDHEPLARGRRDQASRLDARIIGGGCDDDDRAGGARRPAETRKGLAEGLITAALRHPLDQTSSQLVQTMIDTIGQTASGVILQRTIPFEIITPESV